LEVWYSLEKVLRRFALAVLSHQPCNDLKNAPQKTETDLRNRLREPAEPRIASELPDAQGEKSGYMERCALDVSFLGSA